MNIPDATHPIWPILRVMVVLAALGMCLALGYSSGFDSFKDIRTMAIVGGISALVEVLKRVSVTY